jgi:hypothetical protein
MGEVLRESGVAEGWTGSDEDIAGLFDNSLYIRNTSRPTPRPRRPKRAR